jgi:ATP-dependent Clp protease ATP-binding subunit ClpA
VGTALGAAPSVDRLLIRPDGHEHLVLGRLSEPDAPAGRALAEQCIITPKQIRAAMTVVLGPAREQHVPEYTPRAKKVLELTVREAWRLGHNYIGTEHLLLGVLAKDRGSGMLAQIAEIMTQRQAEQRQ